MTQTQKRHLVIRVIARECSPSGLVVDLSLLPWCDYDSGAKLRHIACPVCGEPLVKDGMAGRSRLPFHLERHDCEEFGLLPKGETAEFTDINATIVAEETEITA